MGRKKMNETASDKIQNFKVTEQQREFINFRANAEGMTPSELCRSRSLKGFATFVRKAEMEK